MIALVVALLLGAPAPEGKQVLPAEMAKLADAACACKTFDCAFTAHEKLVDTRFRPHAEGDREAIGAHYRRGMACLRPIFEPENFKPALMHAKRSADRVCKCKTTTCAVEVERRSVTYQESLPHRHDDTPAHDAQEKEYAAHAQRAGRCYAKLPGAIDLAAYEKRMADWAERMCACNRDTACIDKELADLQQHPPDLGALFADPYKINAVWNRVQSCGLTVK